MRFLQIILYNIFHWILQDQMYSNFAYFISCTKYVFTENMVITKQNQVWGMGTWIKLTAVVHMQS